MHLSDLVAVSRRVAGTRKRLAKKAYLSEFLARMHPGDLELVAHYLSGTLPQGRIGLGPAIIREAATAAEPGQGTVAIAELDSIFSDIARISGKGSKRRRLELLGGLLSRVAAAEGEFVIRLLLGELRQGALESQLADAIADAANLRPENVRWAVMLAGHPAPVAFAAMTEGATGLARFRLTPLSPVQPMLAQPAEDIEDALATHGKVALQFKLDGARVQIHRLDDDIRIFTRGLHDVTQSVPEIVSYVRRLPASRLILDGEAIALREDGRPRSFQDTMRRFGRKSDDANLRARLPLDVFLFDILHLDGEDLIDTGLKQRFSTLSAVTAGRLLIPHKVTEDPEEAFRFLQSALGAGHEGVMAKSLDGLYAAGSRGAGWLKVKQVHTLDLVVLAAEWGSGRRRGWLSNLHLGARQPEDGTFVMLGKTFKGLTDKLLAWQTEQFLARELGREKGVVHVAPELVVEIAVNEIQRSPQYPAGLALRFARVKRYRLDKPAAEADTIDVVRAIFDKQQGGSAATA